METFLLLNNSFNYKLGECSVKDRLNCDIDWVTIVSKLNKSNGNVWHKGRGNSRTSKGGNDYCLEYYGLSDPIKKN